MPPSMEKRKKSGQNSSFFCFGFLRSKPSKPIMTFFSVFDLKNTSKFVFKFLPAFFSFFHTVCPPEIEIFKIGLPARPSGSFNTTNIGAGSNFLNTLYNSSPKISSTLQKGSTLEKCTTETTLENLAEKTTKNPKFNLPTGFKILSKTKT